MIWLQGGPGSSSMLGQFELNGPYAAVKGTGKDDVVAKLNPHTWARVANIIYFDQPVGTGEIFKLKSFENVNNSILASYCG